MRLKIKWRTLLAATALLACVHSSHATVESKTVRVPFKLSIPKTYTTWGTFAYPDAGTTPGEPGETPLIQVQSWGGYLTTLRGFGYTSTSASHEYSTAVVYSGELTGHFESGWDRTRTVTEGWGGGLRIDPITPNSSNKSIRIKRVTGHFDTRDFGSTSSFRRFANRMMASFGGTPVCDVSGSNKTFTWDANGEQGSSLGLYFLENCVIDYIDVELEIVTGDDISDSDISSSYDDLFNNRFPYMMYHKVMEQPENGIGQSKYFHTFANIINVTQPVNPDVVADNFTCRLTEPTYSEKELLTTTGMISGNSTSAQWWSATMFYPDGKYGILRSTTDPRKDERNWFRASITRNKEGRVTKITKAKIYFAKATVRYAQDEKVWQNNWAKINYGGGSITEAGVDEHGRDYIVWANNAGTDDLQLKFCKRYYDGTDRTVANPEWIAADEIIERTPLFVELTFNTVEGYSDKPALMDASGIYTLDTDESMTYATAGGSVKVHAPQGANVWYWMLKNDDIKDNGARNYLHEMTYYNISEWNTRLNAGNAIQTVKDATIGLPSNAKFVEFLIVTVDADQKVIGYNRHRLVNSTMTVRTLDDLANRTYTWKDIDGVEHTSLVTDKATDPLQALSLIKEVYTNSWYPGVIWHNPLKYTVNTLFPTDNNHDATWDDTMENLNDPNKSVYQLGWPTEGTSLIVLGARSKLTDFEALDEAWKTYKERYEKNTSETFTSPLFHYGDLADGHGYSNKWKPTMVRFNEIYKSAQLVPGVKRIEADDRYGKDTDYNPGSLFMFSGDYNRFYFISKGNFRNNVGLPFFRHMYEEIAPLAENNMHTDNVYAALMSGIEPVVDHNCASVPLRDHWLQMRENGEAQRLDNMTIFIPDYRNYFGSTGTSDNFNYYSGYRPYMGLYTVQLQAQATAKGEATWVDLGGGEHAEKYTYELTPSWTSTMTRLEEHTSVAGSAAEEFQLYYQELNTATGLYGEWKKLGDPASFLYVNSFSHDVEQKETAQYFNYRVYARLRDTSSEWVLSNEASVVVPGYGIGQLIILPVDIAHRSDFHPTDHDVDGEKNHYKNHLTLIENSAKPMLAAYLEPGMYMEVCRVHGHDLTHDNPVTFCRVNITSKETDENNRVKIGYRIEYATPSAENHLEPAESRYFDASLRAASEGHFTAASGNQKVHFGNGFYLLDQFAEVVAENDHCAHHDYVVKVMDSNGVQKYESNRVRVPIYQTNLTATTFGYSEEQVNADTDAALPAERTAYMTVDVEDHSNIQEYVALRNGETRVSTAQRGATGAYTTFKADKDGKVSVVMDREHHFLPGQGSSMTLQLQDSIKATDESNRWYVAKIEVLTPNLPGTLPTFYSSTYGSNRTVVDNPEVKVSAPHLDMSKPRVDGKVDYRAQLRVTAAKLSTTQAQEAEPYLYRVWRYEEGKEPVLLNTLEDRDYGKGEGRHNTGYAQLNNPPKERVSGDEEADLAMIINDHILDDELQPGQEKKIRYVVRFYARLKSQSDDSDTPNPAPRRTPAAANGQIAEFCVSEQEIEVTFDNNVVTGVTTVKTDTGAQVEQVTYVNALGQQSSKPWLGVNVIVTRYSDGSVSTAKVVK